MHKSQRLNARVIRFCREYMVDGNLQRAVIAAGYSTKSPDTVASRLLASPCVQQYIAELRAKQIDRCEIRADKVLGELMSLAMGNPADLFGPDGTLKPIAEMPRELTACFRSMRIIEQHIKGKGKRTTISSISFWDKPRCLETLARHLGLLQDNVNVRYPDGIPAELKAMSSKDLDAEIVAEATSITAGARDDN